MTAHLIPVALAGVFVAGCFAILALQKWPEIVSNGLAGIFGLVVALLAAEVLTNHMPRQYVEAVAMTAANTTKSDGAATLHPNGQTPMQEPLSYSVPPAFND